MKKLLVLFVSMAFLVACSNDDDNQEQGPDPILGTWVLVDVSTPLDSQFCFDEESTMTFNSNETGQATFYLGAECNDTTAPGTWKNNGNSAYTISVPVLGSLQGTVNFSSNNTKFTFATSVFGIPGTMSFEKQ